MRRCGLHSPPLLLHGSAQSLPAVLPSGLRGWTMQSLSRRGSRPMIWRGGVRGKWGIVLASLWPSLRGRPFCNDCTGLAAASPHSRPSG